MASENFNWKKLFINEEETEGSQSTKSKENDSKEKITPVTTFPSQLEYNNTNLSENPF
ncbi:hypothetical protein [Flavobacterium anhuiense]|uniref:hypothetical protein n=2 Tax=Flavobacteriaceae TaxID=49546 RepID=UPI0016435EB0|nr:hypothetical protein [Flavobacterium anhuiense]